MKIIINKNKMDMAPSPRVLMELTETKMARFLTGDYKISMGCREGCPVMIIRA